MATTTGTTTAPLTSTECALKAQQLIADAQHADARVGGRTAADARRKDAAIWADLAKAAAVREQTEATRPTA